MSADVLWLINRLDMLQPAAFRGPMYMLLLDERSNFIGECN